MRHDLPPTWVCAKRPTFPEESVFFVQGSVHFYVSWWEGLQRRPYKGQSNGEPHEGRGPLRHGVDFTFRFASGRIALNEGYLTRESMDTAFLGHVVLLWQGRAPRFHFWVVTPCEKDCSCLGSRSDRVPSADLHPAAAADTGAHAAAAPAAPTSAGAGAGTVGAPSGLSTCLGSPPRLCFVQSRFLGVDSPLCSIVLFKSQLFPLGFSWFS